MSKGETYSRSGIGWPGDGQSGSPRNDTGRIEETSASAAQTGIIGVLGDASWNRDSLTAENDLWGSGDGTSHRSARYQVRNCGLQNLRNLGDDLRRGSINGVSSSWDGDGDFSGSCSEIGTAEVLGTISLEANKSTEKVVARARGPLLDSSSLEDWEVVDHTWDVGEDGASESSRGKKLGEVHLCACRFLCLGVSLFEVRRGKRGYDVPMNVVLKTDRRQSSSEIG